MNNKWEYQKSGAYKQENNPNWQGGKEVPCSFCGKLVYRRPWELKRNKNQFCSTQCHDDFRRKPKDRIPASEMRGENHPRWNGTKKFCKVCEKELIGTYQRKRNYCSDECVKEGRKNNKGIRRGENHPDWKGGKVTLKCWQCDKDFQVFSSKADKSHYCSNECRHLGKRNRVTLKCLHCEKEFTVAYQRVRDGNPQFCSTRCYFSSSLKTTLETRVVIALNELGLQFIDEYRPKGTRRIFDFYLPSLNILIEADGDFWHHSQWAEKHGQTKRDRDKTKWAIENGYKLIRLREKDVNEFGARILLQKELE